VKLLIIDEVHLLHEDRGPVIEVLIARTLRQVESTQSMIRIVGLSATLPNYLDVASFLKVNPNSGLFYFDSSYRPVPLTQEFIGVKETNPLRAKAHMNDICFDKVIESINQGNQVMVFVHSRKDTAKSAESLIEIAREKNLVDRFSNLEHPKYLWAKKEVAKSRNKELRVLFENGFGIHHAGMLRSDRNLTEKLFSEGLLRVLCCTATLAWGVNLPAHTVIIKGTQLYDAKQGTFVDLGMLDVMQIFG
jgi:activating signal cointegrator complex subunit 3